MSKQLPPMKNMQNNEWIEFLTWRNPFVKLLIPLVLSLVGGIVLACWDVPLWVRIVIYVCFAGTGMLLTICSAAIIIDESQQRNWKRQQEKREEKKDKVGSHGSARRGISQKPLAAFSPDAATHPTKVSSSGETAIMPS